MSRVAAMTSRPRRRAALLLASLTIGLLTASCAQTVPGTATAPTPSAATSTTTVTPDFAAVRYRVPKGFVEQDGYHPITPLEAKRVSHYFPLAGAPTGRDVLALSLYTLPAAHLVDTPAAQLARVKAYNRKTKAKLFRKIKPMTLFGRPAWNEAASEPGGYLYNTWFVFGSRHLLQASCQWDKQQKKITAGCLALLHSVSLS
jgi:hypothetical protein